MIEPDAAAADLNQNSNLQAKVLIRRKKYEMFREISTVQFLEMYSKEIWDLVEVIFCCAGN